MPAIENKRTVGGRPIRWVRHAEKPLCTILPWRLLNWKYRLVTQGFGDLSLRKLSLFSVFDEGGEYSLSDVARVPNVQIWQVVDGF